MAERREGGFDKYLFKALSEHGESAARFFDEVDELPEPSRSRLLEDIGGLKRIRKRHRLQGPR